jgi:hypothetical protein
VGARGPALRTIRTMCLRLSQGSLRLYYGVRSLPVLQLLLLLGYVACSDQRGHASMHVALHSCGRTRCLEFAHKLSIFLILVEESFDVLCLWRL